MKLNLSDDDASKTDYPSHFAIFGGDVKSNPHLAEVINQTVDSKFAIVFDIAVNNGASIVQEINENIQTFKEILSEISGEAKTFLSTKEIQVVATHKGLQIILDMSKTPVFESFTKVVDNYCQNLVAKPIPAFLKVATTGDFEKHEILFIHLTKESLLFQTEVTSFSLKNLLKNPGVSETFKQLLDAKNPAASAFAIALATKKFELNIEIDHKMKNDIWNFVDIDHKDHSFEKVITDLIAQIEKNGGYDFLEMFDSGKNVLRILIKNEVSHVGVFLKLHDIYLGFDVRASLASALTKVLKL